MSWQKQPIHPKSARRATHGASLLESLVSLAIVAILAGTALSYGMQAVAHVRAVLGE